MQHCQKIQVGVNLFLTEAVWAPPILQHRHSNRLPAYSFYGFSCFVLYLINYHAFKTLNGSIIIVSNLGVLTSCKVSETLLTTDVLTQETEKTLMQPRTSTSTTTSTQNHKIHQQVEVALLELDWMSGVP